jgi:hypothetical protein
MTLGMRTYTSDRRCRFSSRVPYGDSLTCGDAWCLTRCHLRFVSNLCHFSRTPLPEWRTPQRSPGMSTGAISERVRVSLWHRDFIAEQHDVIAIYLRWRNQHATPKQGFAVDSKIRLPEFLPYAA